MKNKIYFFDVREKNINDKKYYCPHCSELTKKDEVSNDEYFAACLNCDEDFYKFELVEEVDL